MSRRCKVGQRARMLFNENKGRIVLVVGHYFEGTLWGGYTWKTGYFPWKVVSVGQPLNIYDVGTLKFSGTSMYCVCDDSSLEPLDDDDDGLNCSTEKDEPIKKPKAVKAKTKEPAP